MGMCLSIAAKYNEPVALVCSCVCMRVCAIDVAGISMLLFIIYSMHAGCLFCDLQDLFTNKHIYIYICAFV